MTERERERQRERYETETKEKEGERGGPNQLRLPQGVKYSNVVAF